MVVQRPWCPQRDLNPCYCLERDSQKKFRKSVISSLIGRSSHFFLYFRIVPHGENPAPNSINSQRFCLIYSFCHADVTVKSGLVCVPCPGENLRPVG